jgi:hypothetical protein
VRKRSFTSRTNSTNFGWGDDLGIPAEVALDQVVGLDDMRTGQGRRKSRRGKYLPKTRGVYCN